MKIAYFPAQVALNGTTVFNAVLDCLQANGYQIHENSMHCDAAVIWSVLWSGRMAPNRRVYEHYRAQGKPVIVLEVGALYRGNTWKIAVNNVTAEGYYGHLDQLDWDRPKKLGISLAVQHKTNPSIVLALQHSQSHQVANISNMSHWVRQTLTKLQQHTDRPVVVRPHPRSKITLIDLPPGVVVEQPRRLQNTYDSYDMHYNCHAVINYNSGPGIQAAIAGVRPVVDQSSLAYPVSVEFKDIEQPYTTDRDLWFTQICHTEYTVDEIKKGLWLKRILPALQDQLTVPA